MEVCPVSREVMLPWGLNLYVGHYSRPFACSTILCRPPRRGHLRFPCLLSSVNRQDDRFTAFRRDDTGREGASFRPPIVVSLCPQKVRRATDRTPFGSGLSASFDLSRIHGPSVGGSLCSPIAPAWPPVRLDAGRSGSRLAVRSAPEGEGTLFLPLHTRPLPVAHGQVGYPSGKTGFSS